MSINITNTSFESVVKLKKGDNIYYIPVNTTLFPAGGICCLGRHVSIHTYMPSSGPVIILSCTSRKFNLKTRPENGAHVPKHASDSKLHLLARVDGRIILWHVDPLLGKDRERSSYTTAVAK
jgi:hypothetical protein